MTDDTIELIAEAIFPAMVLAATTFATDCPPDWVKGGNSFVQDEARRAAMRALSAMPQQEVTVKPWLVVHKEPTREQIIKFLEQATRNSSFEGPWDDVIKDTPAALRAISEGE